MKKTLLSLALCGFAGMAFAQGTMDNPISVDDLIEKTTESPLNEEVCVKGYIVGVVDGTGWGDASFTAPFNTGTNMILSGSSTETDPEYCIPVKLPSGSVRTDLSPMGHPENLGHEVIIKGKSEKGFGQNKCVTSVSEYEWVGEAPAAPEVPESERGTKANPLDVAKFLELGASGATVENCWLTGVIVGYVTGTTISGATFSNTGDVSATNILVAASADVKDAAACVAVQLPSGDVRTALNLKDNPGNLGKTVVLHGVRGQYFGVVGLRSVDDYILDGSEAPVTPVVPVIYQGLVDNCEDWTIENGTLPEGLSYVWSWAGDYGLKASAYVSVQGYVTDAWAISPVIDLTGCSDIVLNLEQATNFFKGTQQQQALTFVRVEGGEWQQINLSPDMTEDSWTFVASKFDLNGYKDKKIQIGFNYKSDGTVCGTWEIRNFVINGEGGKTPEPTPDPTPEAKAIYEGLVEGQGDWTVENVTFPAEGLEYVWAWDGKYGMKATSYNSETKVRYEVDSWAISPVIDLTNYKDCSLELEQAGNFFYGLFFEQTHVCVRAEGGDWQVVRFDNEPDGASWTFKKGTVSISNLDGKKIQVGLQYQATKENAGTWEVKNVKIYGTDDSAVETVVAGAEVYVANGNIVAPAGARAFNLNGVETGLENLAAGVYIVVVENSAVKVLVK